VKPTDDIETTTILARCCDCPVDSVVSWWANKDGWTVIYGAADVTWVTPQHFRLVAADV